MGWPKGRPRPYTSPERRNKISLALLKCPTKRLLEHRNITASGCWEYTGSRDGRGYGLIKVGNCLYRCHIVSWRLWVGSTDGLCVLHSCDNTACFNPEHLFLGTREDNNADRDRKGRWKDHWKCQS